MKITKGEKVNSFKKVIASVIEPQGKPSKISVAYHVIMGIIIVLSCVAVFIDVCSLIPSISNFIHIFEIVTVCIFAFEVLLKLIIADVLYKDQGFFKSRISYITSFDFFIDVICIASIFLNQLPSAFGAVKFIKLVKLVRLVKLQNVKEGFDDQEEEPKTSKFKRRVYEVMNAAKKGDVLSKVYDIFAIVVILASVAIVIVETFIKENTPMYTALFIVEVVFTCLFTIEYVLRVWIAEYEYPNLDSEHAKTKYIFSFMAIMDLLAIMPFFLMALPGQESIELGNAVAIVKIFKLLRITRVLKFSRYISAFSLFGKAIKKKSKQIVFSIVIIAFLIFIWSVLLYSFENENNSQVFTNGFSGILYAVQLLVGGEFFDVSQLNPLTTMGNLMVVLMALTGGCMIGVPLGIISGEFGKMAEIVDKEDEEQEVNTFEYVVENLSFEDKLAITATYLPKIMESKKEDKE